MSRSPADVPVSAPLAKPPQRRRIADLHSSLISLPERRIGGRFISFFVWLWPFLKWFWTIPMGLLVGVAIIFLTTPQGSKTSPQSWYLIPLVLTYSGWIIGVSVLLIVLSACSASSVLLKKAAEQAALRRQSEVEEQRESAERERQARPFVLKLVEQLDPDKEPYIHEYVKNAYLRREADDTASTALRAAVTRVGGGPLGICIFGRTTLGKTRLAFETMRAELPAWTFVLWPLNARLEDVDFAAQQGKQIVLWLDDLHKYAATPSEAAALVELQRHFESYAERLVIVATCRDDENKAQVAAHLGSLLERLTPITPAEISREEANALAAELAQGGKEPKPDEYDGTPGSVVLGVGRMLNRYHALRNDVPFGEEAQCLLLALKVLASARIYFYPVPRVRATAADLFHLEAPRWHHALELAVEQGFLRPEALAAGEEGKLDPYADVYLDKAVSEPGGGTAAYWPELEKSLARRQDADALNSLVRHAHAERHHR